MDPNHRQIISKFRNMLTRNVNISDIKQYLQKYKIFTNMMLEDIYTLETYNLFDEIVTRGPNAFQDLISVLKDAGYEKEARSLSNYTGISSSETCYKMNSKPLGYCLIINNVEFEKRLCEDDKDSAQRYREGSDIDAKGLREVFQKVGFEVAPIERNLKADQMRIRLAGFANFNQWKSVDACVVCVLSHGYSCNNIDVILGTDNDFITKDDIIEMFNNFNCNGLQDKPKMFFFQACRGNEEDNGVGFYEPPKTHSKKESADASSLALEKLSIKKPTISDVFIVHTTLPGHKSYRLHETGSWFCQDFIKVFSENYLELDFDNIIDSVQILGEQRVSVEGKKQVVHYEKRGPKGKVYFKGSTC